MCQILQAGEGSRLLIIWTEVFDIFKTLIFIKLMKRALKCILTGHNFFTRDVGNFTDVTVVSLSQSH